MLTGTKPAAQSLGVWGGAIAALAGLGGLAGYAIAPEDAAELGAQADAIAAGATAAIQAATSLVAMIGGAIAILGRIRATRRIGAPAAAGPASDLGAG